MKMNYSELSDMEINALVGISVSAPDAKIAKRLGGSVIDISGFTFDIPDYCNNPKDAWPIILENHISLMKRGFDICWDASAVSLNKKGCTIRETDDENPLRAAMIVYLMINEATQ
jgi:hypothetical protein